MKKILLFVAIAAAMLLASCQKEVPVETVKADTSTVVKPPVFTATISPGTKTTVDAASGKVSWEEGDEITITDKKNQKSAVYRVKSIAENGKATFEFNSGATLGDGPYTATYGTAPAIAQTYSEKPGKLYMKAESLTKSLTFKVQCGLMEIKLTKDGESVKSVAVTGIPTGKSATTYTLTCNNESIASQKSFYITVPAGTYHKIVITDAGDKDCTLTAASGLAVAANHIKPVTFDGSKLVFKHSKLTGVFSVSATKKVQFSRGNLVATIDTSGKPVAWKFAVNQYDCLGTGGANRTIGTAAGNVDLFGWSTNASSNNWGIHTSTTDEYIKGDFKDWSNAIDVNKWRTLSEQEWAYLLEAEEGPRKYKRATGVTVCGIKNCLILMPDDYKSESGLFRWEYTVDEWATAEEAGFVCLPPAGVREANSVNMAEQSGYYWSSDKSNNDSEAKSIQFYKIESQWTVQTSSTASRHRGFSVRLVTDVK